MLRMHTEAEVFALNGLVVATVLWLAAARGPVRGAGRAVALGLVAGLGLANHLTCVLVAPIGLLGLVRAGRELHRPAYVAWALGAAGIIVGLTPYAYLVLTEETLLSWARIDDLGGVVNHFLRKDYGGPGQFSPRGTEVPVVVSLGAMVGTLGRVWLWLPLAVGLATLATHIVRPRGPESRWAWGMLTLAVVLSGPVLASRFNVEPVGIGLYICERFHILPALLLAIPVAVSFDHLGAWLQQRSSGGRSARLCSAAWSRRWGSSPSPACRSPIS